MYKTEIFFLVIGALALSIGIGLMHTLAKGFITFGLIVAVGAFISMIIRFGRSK